MICRWLCKIDDLKLQLDENRGKFHSDHKWLKSSIFLSSNNNFNEFLLSDIAKTTFAYKKKKENTLHPLTLLLASKHFKSNKTSRTLEAAASEEFDNYVFVLYNTVVFSRHYKWILPIFRNFNECFHSALGFCLRNVQLQKSIVNRLFKKGMNVLRMWKIVPT